MNILYYFKFSYENLVTNYAQITNFGFDALSISDTLRHSSFYTSDLTRIHSFCKIPVQRMFSRNTFFRHTLLFSLESFYSDSCLTLIQTSRHKIISGVANPRDFCFLSQKTRFFNLIFVLVNLRVQSYPFQLSFLKIF